MRSRIFRRPVLWYFILTMAATLLLLVPHLLWGVLLTPSFSLNQFGPAAGLLLFCMLSGSSEPLRGAAARFSGKKLFRWGLAGVLATAVLLISCGALLSLWGVPFARWDGGAGFYSLECLAMLAGCAAEEVGWRGFLLPKLCESRSLFAGSLIVGVLWGIWHLNFAEGPLGFALFTASIALHSIFLAWLYQKSGRNLSVAVLEHFSFNLFSHLFLWNRLGTKAFLLEIALYGAADLIVVGADRKLFFARPRRRPAGNFDRSSVFRP